MVSSELNDYIVLLDPWMGSYQVLRLKVKVVQGIVTANRCTKFPKDLGLQSHHQEK